MKKLHFGCGKKSMEGKEWVNADRFSLPHVDEAFNFNKFPYPFKDNTFDYVYSADVFEHLGDLQDVMKELLRICKNNAELYIIVPYYNHLCAFNDPDHTHWFNEFSFDVLLGNRGSPSSVRNGFEIISQKFKPGKYWRWIPKKLLLKLSHYIPNLIIRIDVELKVVKQTPPLK